MTATAATSACPGTEASGLLWGKSNGLDRPYPLIGHLLDTAAVATELVQTWMPPGLRARTAQLLQIPHHELADHAAALAALHDTGKAIPPFQRLDSQAWQQLTGRHPHLDVDAPPGGHATAGANILTELGFPAATADVVAGHHGRYAPREDPLLRCAVVSGYGGPGWDTLRADLLALLHQVLPQTRPGTLPGPEDERALSAYAVLTGVVIVADWLASSETFLATRCLSAADATDPAHLGAHLASARRQAPQVLAAAGLVPAALRQPSLFTDAFPHISTPRPLQQAIDHALVDVTEPAVVVVTAPMGEGKTEAALHAAARLADATGRHGVHLALPTQATADQMHQRMLGWLPHVTAGAAHTTLLHGQASLNPTQHSLPRNGPGLGAINTGGADAGGHVVAADWLRGAKRGQLAQFSVSTIDQLLLAALRLRHQPLRLLGLAGRVLVVDEAHAYDAYQQQLLRRALTWAGHLHVPAVILSATLPSSVAGELVAAWHAGVAHRSRLPAADTVPYPGWLVRTASGRVTAGGFAPARPHQLRLQHHNTATDPTERAQVVADLAGPVLAERGSVLVVCNTVTRAQQVSEQLALLLPDDVPTTLHSRFPTGQRRTITDRLLQRFGPTGTDPDGRRGLVVATQVVEQSLDVDFDLVISDHAPAAQLLQRAGRGHRHPRTRPRTAAEPCLAVLVPTHTDGTPQPAADRMLYPELHLRLTHQHLHRRDRVRIPDDVQPMMEQVYADYHGEDSTLQDAANAALAAHGVAAAAAGLATVPAPAGLEALVDLTSSEDEHGRPRTRLGADSVLVLPVLSESGAHLLIPDRQPAPAPGRPRLGHDRLRTLLDHTVPVSRPGNQSWLSTLARPWPETGLLNRVHLLALSTDDGIYPAVRIERTRLTLHPRLGLCIDKEPA